MCFYCYMNNVSSFYRLKLYKKIYIQNEWAQRKMMMNFRGNGVRSQLAGSVDFVFFVVQIKYGRHFFVKVLVCFPAALYKPKFIFVLFL